MDEISEALANQTKTWTHIAMGACSNGGGHHGYGNTRDEAVANANDHGCVDQMKVGEFTGPVHVVVDMMGRVFWDDAAVELKWEEPPTTILLDGYDDEVPIVTEAEWDAEFERFMADDYQHGVDSPRIKGSSLRFRTVDIPNPDGWTVTRVEYWNLCHVGGVQFGAFPRSPKPATWIAKGHGVDAHSRKSAEQAVANGRGQLARMQSA